MNTMMGNFASVRPSVWVVVVGCLAVCILIMFACRRFSRVGSDPAPALAVFIGVLAVIVASLQDY